MNLNLYIVFFFLFAIGLFLLTQYLRIKQIKKNEDIEHFNSLNTLSSIEKLEKYHNIILRFMDADVARNLITKNNKYLLNMNQANLFARSCVSKDDLYNKYLHAFENITTNERNNIIDFILNLLIKIQQRSSKYYNYICYWIQQITIAKAKPWLENGMPHTLEMTIIMDIDWFKNPRENTFIHELTHIHQRKTPFEFEDIYKDLGYINFTKGVNNIKGMESVLILNRNNPDGLNYNWIWKDQSNNTYWWVGAIFTSATPHNLLDVSNIALQLEYNNDTFYYLKQYPTLLKSFKNFNIYFGNDINNYHPNEISAKFNELYLEYILGMTSSHMYDNEKSKKYSCDGFKIYKTNFEKIINTFYSNNL